MMIGLMLSRRLMALSIACAAFIGLIVFELLPGNPNSQPISNARSTPAAPLAKPQPKASAGELMSTILAAPLFSPTRHPPEATGGAASGPELNDVRLTGIVVAPDRRLAIFAVPGSKAIVRSEGEELDGWRLDSISELAVSLSGPGGTRTLEPRPDRDLVRSGAAGPVSPPQSAPAPKPTPTPPPGTGTPLLMGPLKPLRPLGGRRS